MPARLSVSRRRALQAAAAAVAVPLPLASSVVGAANRTGPNDQITIGFVGCGGRARQLMSQLPAEGRMLAVADCEMGRAEQAAAAHGIKADSVYQSHRPILERQDIDAVFVITMDHARVLPCIEACQAGKDIYAEKPLTVYIGEGRALVDAVRKHKRIFQVGTQQRTMEMNRFACELVRKGGIGKLHTVLGVNYHGPGRYGGLPKQERPDRFDWDLWQNQVEQRPYHSRLHRGWMSWRSYSGGQMTNWGAHGLDQVQWALGASESGPVELWTITPGHNGAVGMRYASGVEVRLELDKGPMGGAIFVGDEAKIEINRNKFTTNPPDLIKDGPSPAKAKPWEGPGWIAKPHMQNFFDCMRSREKPNADVEIGHRSITVCHLANIVRELGRRLHWDPKAESFRNDDEANALVTRARREEYELPTL